MEISRTLLFLFTFSAAFVITCLVENKLIPLLRRRAKQPIYSDGPIWHESKCGTPTMGGLAFLVAFIPIIIAASLYFFYVEDGHAAYTVIISGVFALFNASIGVIDDLTKLRRKENAGLTPLQKIILQSVFTAIFLFLRAEVLGDTTVVSIGSLSIDLGIFYYPLSAIILLGIVNCANLTDGVDGLATSVSFAIGTTFFFLFSTTSTDTSVIAVALVGISVAFLVFNIHPARIFMGDTGSLFLGALVATLGFAVSNPIFLLFVCSVYVVEGVSVILQVLYYKLTKKRIFKMAPIHHHLEQCGIGEEKISIIAITVTFVFSIVGAILFL